MSHTGSNYGHRLSVPSTPWHATMDLLERVAGKIIHADRVDVAFLKTLWPDRKIPTLGSYRASLASLGFLNRGIPTNALRALGPHTRGSREWNEIVWERFIWTYEPVFGTPDVLSVDPEKAREAIATLGGRSGASVKGAVRFFLNGAKELLRQDAGADSVNEETDLSPPWWRRDAASRDSRSLPYVRWSTFNELLRRLSESRPLPQEISDAFLHQAMPMLEETTHVRYRSAMKSLRLVDDHARPTSALQALIRHTHGSGQWRSLLRKGLACSYGKALGFAEAVGVDEETAERKIKDWTGSSRSNALASLRFLRAALRDTQPNPALPELQPTLKSAELQEYAVHKLPWHGRSDPFVVKVPFDLKKAEWRWVDGYVRRWISGAWKEQRE